MTETYVPCTFLDKKQPRCPTRSLKTTAIQYLRLVRIYISGFLTDIIAIIIYADNIIIVCNINPLPQDFFRRIRTCTTIYIYIYYYILYYCKRLIHAYVYYYISGART